MRLRPENIVPPHGAVYVSYTLAGGEITAQGVSAFPKLSQIPPTVVDAVSGGTEVRWCAGRGKPPNACKQGDKHLPLRRLAELSRSCCLRRSANE